MNYTYEDFDKIKEFLDAYGINYTDGNYYGEADIIVGHWIKIDADIETNEISYEDKIHNES